ncbi:DNA-directed RNA polymerase I subunit RPA43 [Heterodontus francisci]|uniref:DNA-directed RNA polymerase I subunit RPA43 n=1 Tax=Heterodontus francisci TaxID=7792 RepID=UPI00355AE188
MANSVGAGEAESSASGLSQQLSFSQACSLIKNPYSCLVLDTCRRHIALSPMYLKRQRSGIERQLRTELLRFSESLQGVPIAYDKVRLVGELGDIYDDQGYIHLNIEADFVIFRPKTGQKLVGVVNKVAPSHLGCLVHGCFNASIPKPHHANGIWPGFAVTVGDSLKFEVLQLDADVAGVLCIRGQLDKSVQAAYGVDSEEPLEKNSDQNDEIASKKKKKKRHKGEKCVREGTTEEAVSCEISDESLHKDGMGNTKIISDSNKFKKRKRKTVQLNTDTEIHGRDDCDYHSDKAIKKKKRKLSEGDSEPTNCTKEPKCKKK